MKICAVIVTFNRSQMLLQTIEALCKQTYNLSKIIIVDNNSSDNTTENLLNNSYIKEPTLVNDEYIYQNDFISYIKLVENTGGAGGFHRAIAEANKYDFDWVWLMDDDICPRKDTLQQYVSFITRNNNLNIGAVMGLRYYENTPFCFESKSHNFTDWKVSLKETDMSISIQGEYTKIADFPFEGPIISTNIIKMIGLPNKDYFIIGDDTDYAIRINAVSNSYYLPSAKFDRLVNPISHTSNKFTWKHYYLLRNMIALNKKYGKNWKVKYFRTLLISYLTYKKYLVLAFKHKDISFIQNTDKIIQAYIEGMSNNLGRKYVPGDF